VIEMADKILSQDEVDALLRGMDAGDVDTTPKEDDPGGIRTLDLSAQERMVRGKMPTFEMINDRFCRMQTVSWAAVLRRPVEFSMGATDIMKFGEMLKKVPVPASLSLFQLKPLRGHGLVIMGAPLVYALVDNFFGGHGQTHVKTEGRDFTPVQQRVIKTMLERLLTDLEKAWHAVLPAKVHFVRSESNPQFAMVVSIPEIVVSVSFHVDLAGISHKVMVMYPYSMIEPIKEKLSAGFFADQMEEDQSWMNRFRDQLLDCPVDLTVQLGITSVPMKDVLQFGVGDVVLLEQSPGDLMTGFVEGIPKLLGAAGVVKGANAYRVVKSISGPVG
jgi:flagellar motor switch protein FliM